MRLHAFLIAACVSGAAFAADTGTFSCDNLDQYDQYEQLRLDPEKVMDCVNRGYDPPLNWRPSLGRSVSALGAGTTLTHGQNAPESTPGKLGVPASVSNTRWGLALSMPPWQGFPCQLPGGISLCGGGSGGSGGGTSCPARDDTSGTFGESIALNTLTSKALPCGGTVSLTSMPFSVAPDATRIAIADEDEYVLKVYQFSATTSKFELYDKVPLPQQLCKRNSDGSMAPSVNLQPPIPQLFSYANNTTHLAVRLRPAPGQVLPDPFAPMPGAQPEKYLIVPIVAGMPKDLAANCESENDYYKSTLPPTNDIYVVPTGGVAGGAAGEEGEGGGTCDTSTLYPEGATCGSVMLVVVTDDPQLIHTPGSNAEFLSLNDRGEVMNKSTPGSILMIGEGALIRVNGFGQKVGLPDGGTIPLKDGNFLVMDGPVEITGGTTTITLTSGGKIVGANGDQISHITAGATISANADLPFYIKPLNRAILPSALWVPGKPGGYLRLPVSTM